MGVQPQDASGNRRINSSLLPPRGFIAAAVNLAMMTAAHRNCELVADLPPECPALHETEVVSVRRSPAADQTRVGGDKFDVPRSRIRRGSGSVSTLLSMTFERLRRFVVFDFSVCGLADCTAPICGAFAPPKVARPA